MPEVKQPPTPEPVEAKSVESPPVLIVQTDSLAERVRKMQILKKQGSLEREGSKER